MHSDISRNAPAGPTTGDDGTGGPVPLRTGSASARTREQLILAAERLFALHGIDNVSLRQINTEAGQRNSSAAHYHFGSKEALIRAIHDYRLARIDARRRELFEQLVASGHDDQPRQLIQVLVQPILEEIDTTEGGGNYILFKAQVFAHPALELRSLLRGQFAESVGRIYYRLRLLMPTVPDAIFSVRFGMAREMIVNSLADRTRLMEAGSPRPEIYGHPALFIDNLVDAAEAVLTAPVSAITARELAALQRSGPA
jgi:AcrR family transcriptional regulator